jgi:hypothetical protein
MTSVGPQFIAIDNFLEAPYYLSVSLYLLFIGSKNKNGFSQEQVFLWTGVDHCDVEYRRYV